MSRLECSSCSKSFARKGDLTRHELLHTGVKPHVCETCGRGFAQFSGLKTHWNVHSKAKPYICGIGTCKKSFGDPSSRTRHRKETHRREGAYKCIVENCGTRIKRRSAFVAHLRKHGLDPKTVDLNAIVLQSNGVEIPAPTTFASSSVDKKAKDNAEGRDVSSVLSGASSGFQGLYENDGPNHSGSGDGLPDYRQAFLANDAFFLGSIPEQTTNVGQRDPSRGIHPCLFSNPENPFNTENIFSTTVNQPFPDASPLNLPILEPFLEVGNDGFQSTSPSPFSRYSALYTAGFDDDLLSLSLGCNAPQESFSPYNFIV